MSVISYFIIFVVDKIIAFFALIILLPIFFAIAIVLRFTGEGEILYKQTRIGKRGKEFKILKFATMLKNSPSIGAGELTLPDDERVLPVGKFLRKSKLNELPQLINVLKGDMSIIGPRPQTPLFFNCFDNDDAEKIYSIAPGLSGIGSLMFRNEEDLFKLSKNPKYMDEAVIMPYKGKLECWYVDNYSFWNYLIMIVLTIIEIMLPGKIKLPHIFKNLPKPPQTLEKIWRKRCVDKN